MLTGHPLSASTVPRRRRRSGRVRPPSRLPMSWAAVRSPQPFAPIVHVSPVRCWSAGWGKRRCRSA